MWPGATAPAGQRLSVAGDCFEGSWAQRASDPPMASQGIRSPPVTASMRGSTISSLAPRAHDRKRLTHVTWIETKLVASGRSRSFWQEAAQSFGEGVNEADPRRSAPDRTARPPGRSKWTSLRISAALGLSHEARARIWPPAAPAGCAAWCSAAGLRPPGPGCSVARVALERRAGASSVSSSLGPAGVSGLRRPGQARSARVRRLKTFKGRIVFKLIS